MNFYDDEHLTIKVIEHSDLIEMIWIGKGDEEKTYLRLELYLDKLLNQFPKEKIEIHLEEILYFNSQCLSKIFSFLARLRDRAIQTRIHYTKASSWQNATIRAFKTLHNEMEYIAVEK